MNKELTPLEAFYKLKESIEYVGGDFYCANEQRLNIIETALKALEIIKEKNIAIKELQMSGDVEMYATLYRRLYYNVAWGDIQWRIPTQEEYDLLKEVLICD